MLQFERFTLGNGLRVIVHTDKSTPMVAFNVLYDVGARDEDAAQTGFAHLFEHLMFGGSINIPEYDEPLQMAGGENNAYTTNDITNYYRQLPLQNMETAFWLESDRMGYFLPGLTQERLAVQQSVVRTERRQRYEAVPYSAERFELALAMYPDGHPHRHLTIGLHEHIQSATLADVEAWYRTWYVPANATLVITGDVERAEVHALVDRYFGSFPASTRPERLSRLSALARSSSPKAPALKSR